MGTDKRATSWRISDEGLRMVEDLARWYGTTATGAIEIALRVAHRAGMPEGGPLTRDEVESMPDVPPTPAKKRGRPRRPLSE